MKPSKGVRIQLASVRTTSTQFNNLTNFILDEFEDLCIDVCPIIAVHGRITGEPGMPLDRYINLLFNNKYYHYLCF